jgi:hypothetical protein
MDDRNKVFIKLLNKIKELEEEQKGTHQENNSSTFNEFIVFKN